jgi:hypothetical protein
VKKKRFVRLYQRLRIVGAFHTNSKEISECGKYSFVRMYRWL